MSVASDLATLEADIQALCASVKTAGNGVELIFGALSSGAPFTIASLVGNPKVILRDAAGNAVQIDTNDVTNWPYRT